MDDVSYNISPGGRCQMRDDSRGGRQPLDDVKVNMNHRMMSVGGCQLLDVRWW